MQCVHTHSSDLRTDFFFFSCFTVVCYEMFSLSLHTKIQNAEQDQGYRLAREEFHSWFSACSALPCRIWVVSAVVASWQYCSDSNWLEKEKKSFSVDLALDCGFHLWMKFLTVCADKYSLKEAASLSGLEGEEEGQIQQWEGYQPTHNVSPCFDSDTHVATSADDSDFHSLLSVLLSSS